MVQAKLESKKRIGILGGTFDPAHIGHVKISKVAKKILKLDKIIWAITSKNPFKDKSLINIDKSSQVNDSVTEVFQRSLRCFGCFFWLLLLPLGSQFVQIS